MVTRIHGGAGRRPLPLFLAEHMKAKGVSDERLAGRMDVDRVTVTRWRNGKRKPNTDKIAALEDALDLKPGDLRRPPAPPPAPKRAGIDAILEGAPDEVVEHFANLARLWKIAQ